MINNLNMLKWWKDLAFLNVFKKKAVYLFHDGGPYHRETSPLLSSANQWIGFYVIGTSFTKELISIQALSKQFY